MSIKIIDLEKSFNKIPVLNKISLEIDSITALVGNNGSGKTTLVKCLSSLLIFENGKININSRLFDKNSFWKLKNHVTSLIDGTRSFYSNLTLMENLKYYSLINNINYLEQINYINYLFDKFEIMEFKNKLFSKLSRGTQQKFALITALIKNSEFLILDEPSIALDFGSLLNLKLILKDEAKKRSILICSHDINLLYNLVDKIYFINKGNVIYFDVLKDNSFDYLLNILSKFNIGEENNV